MKTSATKVRSNVDEYIAGFPAPVQKLLKQLRNTIKKAASKAEETISYQMPAYKLHGPLVYFAGYKNHIGFYPAGSAIKSFINELDTYKTSKGTVQFPVDQPLPIDLINRMISLRVKENSEKAALKAKSKK